MYLLLLVKAIQVGDEERMKSFARIFVELAESLYELIVQAASPEMLKFLEILLVVVSIPSAVREFVFMNRCADRYRLFALSDLFVFVHASIFSPFRL